jgi:hypothetical protein
VNAEITALEQNAAKLPTTPATMTSPQTDQDKARELLDRSRRLKAKVEAGMPGEAQRKKLDEIDAKLKPIARKPLPSA